MTREEAVEVVLLGPYDPCTKCDAVGITAEADQDGAVHLEPCYPCLGSGKKLKEGHNRVRAILDMEPLPQPVGGMMPQVHEVKFTGVLMV